MGQQNRRQAVRVVCDLPVRLEGGEAELLGHLVDLSRTGCRIRVPGRSVGVHRLSSLVQVKRQLEACIGTDFSGDLHYEALGPLVKRAMHMCRIAKRDWEQTDVEIGCRFDVGLTDDEVGMLGVPLPAIGEEAASESLHGAGPRRRGSTDQDAPRLRIAPPPPPPEHTAYVYPAPGKSAPPLVTRTLSLTRGMAILAVDPGQGIEGPDKPVGSIVEALDAAYGRDILLRVVDGESDLWTGPAEIKEVDVGPESGTVKLGIAFGRELRTEELGRLGLPTPA